MLKPHKADKAEVIKRVKEMVRRGEISKSHHDPIINKLYPKKIKSIKKRIDEMRKRRA